MKHRWTAVAPTIMALILSVAGDARPFDDPRSEKNEAIDQAAANEPRDQACYMRSLASTGAAMPRNEHTLVVRWMGYSNFELVYGGHILLLDAYYDRGSEYPSLGFQAADIKQADARLLATATSTICLTRPQSAPGSAPS